jgi:hypothetical protein
VLPGGYFKPIKRDRPVTRKAAAAIKSVTHEWLTDLGAQVAAAARDSLDKLQKDDKNKKHPAEVYVEDADFGTLRDALLPHIEAVAKDGAKRGLKQVSTASKAEIDKMLSQANDDAVEWASERAGELIKGVEDTTKDGVKLLVARSLDEGWTNDELADALEEATEFGEERAKLIATTETAFADIRGNRIGWEASGVTSGRRWVKGTDNIEVCDECEAMDGKTADNGKPFVSDSGEEVEDAPLHPRCRCDEEAVLADEPADSDE